MVSNIARSCLVTMSEMMLVLGAGQLGAPNQPQARSPQARMDAGAEPATLSAVPARACVSARTTSVGKLVLEVDTSQLDVALVKVGQLRLALSKLMPD